MDKPNKSQLEQRILFLIVAVAATVHPPAVYGDIFCPPAISYGPYTITGEVYNVSLEYQGRMFNVSLMSDSYLLSYCNAEGCTTGYPHPNGGPVVTQATVAPLGYNSLQAEFHFPYGYHDNLTGNFSILWGVDSSVADAEDSCVVELGGLINECASNNPCVHALGCQDKDSGYFCKCQPGYSGVTCKAGDMELYCDSSYVAFMFNESRDECEIQNLYCYVAGFQDELHITTDFSPSKVGRQVLFSSTVSGSTVTLAACVHPWTPPGHYDVSLTLRANEAVAEWVVTLVADIYATNATIKFNQDGYIINITETDNQRIILVYKSNTPTCFHLNCIEVINSNAGPASGFDSLFLQVTEQQATAPVRYMANNTENSFGYFYIAGQLEPSYNYSFVLSLSMGAKGSELDSAFVVFMVTDVNDPPVCLTKNISADLDIRTQPPVILGSVNCTDNDTTVTFQQISYYLTGDYSDYFDIDRQGTLSLSNSLMVVPFRLLNLTIIVNGFNEGPYYDGYNINIPVNINIAIPAPECNLTIDAYPNTWEANSTVSFKLTCDHKGVGRPQNVFIYCNYSSYVVTRQEDSSTDSTIIMTVESYIPGLYNFTVDVTLGGPSISRSVLLPIYNPPQFYQIMNFNTTNIWDTSPVGSTVLTLGVMSDNPDASVLWTLVGGDPNSILTPHSGVGNIVLFQDKSVEKYVGDQFSLVFEARDSVTGLTTNYTLNFTIADTNQPPVCNINSSQSNSILSKLPPGTVIASVLCQDPDITPEFTNLSYSVATISLNISSSGEVRLAQAFPPGVLSVQVNVTVTDMSFSVTITFEIVIMSLATECNMAVETDSDTWAANSTITFRLTCDNNQLPNINVYSNYSDYSMPTVVTRNEGSTTNSTIVVTLEKYIPGTYAFIVNVTLGGQVISESVVLHIYNPPQFYQIRNTTNIWDTSPVGSTVLMLGVTSDIPGASVMWTLAGGDPNSILTPHSGVGNIVLFQDKSVEQYAGDQFSLVFEVRDSISNLTTNYTLNFTIADTNQPPVCHISPSQSVSNISSGPPGTVSVLSNVPPGTVIASVVCQDPDITPEFTNLSYSVATTPSTVSLNISSSGEIRLAQAFPPGVLSVQVYVTVTDMPFYATKTFEIVIISLATECNMTVETDPETWAANSTITFRLTCDYNGVDQLLNINVYSNYSDYSVPTVVTRIEGSTTNSTIIVTLEKYIPGTYAFIVNVTLGGHIISESVVLHIYNPPQFYQIRNTTYIWDTSPVGSTVLMLGVTSDIPGASVMWTLAGGDPNSILTPHSGVGNIVLFQNKSVEQYVGDQFSLVFEALDSISTLTTNCTWNFTVIDTNQPPVCQISPSQTVRIYSNVPPGTNIASVLCRDPDITPEFTHQLYSVSTSPSTVSLNISSSGEVRLAQTFPPDVLSVQVNVTVTDTSFKTVYTFQIVIVSVTCPSETADSGLRLPETPVNSSVTVNCSELGAGYIGQASAVCRLNKTWGSLNYSRCQRKDLQAATDVVNQLQSSSANTIPPQEVTTQLGNVSQQLAQSVTTSDIKVSADILQVVHIISKVAEVTQQYPNSTLDKQSVENFATACNNVLDAPDHVWTDAREEGTEDGALLVQAMDNIIQASLRVESIVNEDPIVRENLVIKRESTSSDIQFPKPEDAAKYKNWVLSSDNSMFLSREAFKTRAETITYGVVLYQNATDKLRVNPRIHQDEYLVGKVLNSHIVSLTTNMDIGVLSPQLQLSFSVLEGNYSNASCAYLNTRTNLTGVWATDGCTSTRKGDRVLCTCNHLTNFAILMSPSGDPPPDQKKILSIISAVGCGISIFCLIITIIVYALLWKYVKCDRAVLHINLSICLILAYTIFLAGVTRTDSPIGCKVVAALIHYIYLVVFFIMLSEGIEIFKSVSIVFTSRSILWQLLLLAYGVPAVIVAISLGVTKANGYGTKTSCWLSVDDGLIWAFVGPVLLILLINLVILLQVLRIMQRTKQMMNKTAQQKTRSIVRTVAILSPILGVTWVFGVLSVNQETLVFQYLFVIFNSLQGLAIFICYCLIPHQMRDGFRAVRRKYHAKSFDSSHILSAVSRSMSHSYTDPNYSQQPTASTSFRESSSSMTQSADTNRDSYHAQPGLSKTDSSNSRGLLDKDGSDPVRCINYGYDTDQTPEDSRARQQGRMSWEVARQSLEPSDSRENPISSPKPDYS